MRLVGKQRVEAYHRAFPRFPPLYLAGDRIEGLWFMGNQYQTSGYYGAYPHGYLDRVMSMFQDAREILHLFSGSLPAGDYTRFDIHPGCADVVGDAHDLAAAFPVKRFDLILADPPYSAEDAEHYGTKMVNRSRVLAECLRILEPDGWVVWLDQVMPMFRKDRCCLAMAIGMVKSTNHRVRAVFGFQRV